MVKDLDCRDGWGVCGFFRVIIFLLLVVIGLYVCVILDGNVLLERFVVE